MSSSSEESAYRNGDSSQKKFKGVRRRKWGKWVSEIRVPGTPERLWLGSYATPEAAAVARDVAFYCLRGNSSPQNLNFPLTLPAGARPGLSPRSVQRVASDAGLATDARLIGSKDDGGDSKIDGDDVNNNNNISEEQQSNNPWRQNGDWSGSNDQGYLNISVEDYF
ncbi:ethylene-responsive transcription factor erf020 [Phtheirospermum japonicum]|uniref:Ethylene-responsive transcription factor erf020 n=1 Tax=Phtheirospermum japonicum TaxID=374723 RepID=A0A830D054_9LAMI|nr:ethylene-responsive transcription factor erf020 [Phtheirospermum japonicum]